MPDTPPEPESPLFGRSGPAPTTKPDAPLSLDELVARVEAAARRLGEDPRAIVREVRNGTPIGRMILKLLGLRPEKVSRGRPHDIERLKRIDGVVSNLLWDGKSRAEAFKAAPGILASKYGIFGTTRPPRPLTTKRVREAFEKRALIWFEPVD